MKRKVALLSAICVILALFAMVFARESGNAFQQIQLLSSVISAIKEEYVDPIDFRKLIKGALDGMTSTLDPHTVFFTQKQYEDLQIDTRGSFGGLGIQIGMRDNWLTVIAPMEGTPAHRAGILAGDRIVKIEGKSTRGITTDKAISQLRGEPGTKVVITIEREGDPQPFDVDIVRAVIEIKPVPYYGLTKEGVGYIRLSTFSQEAGEAVGKALADLKKQGAKGIIFDLRSNPGGLLTQAVDVASHFLQANDLVVYTKGKTATQTRKYFTYATGEYPEGPLVVLVDEGSASASEIVAGAIQDHDRGLVLGATTFGKGLVQSVRPLNGGTALKITTAKYYIPSARCIQREEYLKNKRSAIISEFNDTDTLDAETDPWDFDFETDLEPAIADSDTVSLKKEDKPKFKTESGRTVYGGGGITPDIEFKASRLSRIEFELLRKNLFFDYIVHYLVSNRSKIKSTDYPITDEMLTDFRNYVQNEKKFEFKTRSEYILAQLDSVAEEDSVSQKTKTMLAQIKSSLKEERDNDFDKYRDRLRKQLRRTLISSIFGEKERYTFDLDNDETVREAARIITDTKLYKKHFDQTVSEPKNGKK